MAPTLEVREGHHTAGFYAAIFLPLLASIAVAVGGFFAFRRFRHHFKYNRIIAEDGERQTLTMELPNTSAVYEKARGTATELATDLAGKARVQALEYSDKARVQALELGDKARTQAFEYGDKARGYFKVPDSTGIRGAFEGFLSRFKKVDGTAEESAKLQFELPETSKAKDEESSEEEDEEEEEEEVPAGKAPKWTAESKKAELKGVPGAPQAAYDPVATTGRAPTKTAARK